MADIKQIKTPDGTVYNLRDDSKQFAVTGGVQMYAGSVTQTVSGGQATVTGAPDGWLLCDGSELLKSLYPELAAVLQDTYGTPSDNNHFLLPNFCGRVPVGVGQATATGATAHTLGQADGEETHTLQTGEIPSHNHGEKSLTGSFQARHYGTSGSGSQLVFNRTGIVSITNKDSTIGKVNVNGAGSNGGYELVEINATHTHSSVGSGNAHQNMQPYLGINYIICAGRSTI